ncbi:putative serine/threonine-protein kinase [Acorus calamus]|uniref:[RNA-polymerase]-subunit kinase n=1 Tax=Acorus calamus TaxID=4465 RepID=A0AAV9CZ06_ACOCL|nr:putative serine/threonine-protein kinase [Acorus calamus]
MGCVSSKQTVSVTPALDCSNSGALAVGVPRRRADTEKATTEKKKKKSESGNVELGESGRAIARRNDSVSFRLGNLHEYIEGEQVAAGWPAWLSAVAGEAIRGWIPLKADSFEKLEKIGQGTYSTVFQARDLDTGKIVALKKVRFDNFEPESIRFMAREIQILRRLDHPNIVKLQGLITSRLSCSIYLVFEYMEHDLSGLSSCPDIKFSEAQVKCYMHQLLSGLEHCHSRGIMHRDIKGANLLVNNEGILKMADFGLANILNPAQKQPLTSRVVTLWYRPPELLLGSTEYGVSVDLWSVGCVFAELLLGKPILQGRTEVEQLHKIFKLCGSPPDDYWKKSKLPHATIFKPQNPYDSCLRETFKDLPESAVSLIETLLSIEPYKRGTASSALASQYFTTKPYACDPSSLPKYPPNKEIDAKCREEARRKKAGGRVRGLEATRRPARLYKPSRELHGLKKLVAPTEESQIETRGASNAEEKIDVPKKVDTRTVTEKTRLVVDPLGGATHLKHASQGDMPFSGPLHVSSSSNFEWAKKWREEKASMRSHSKYSARGCVSSEVDPSNALSLNNNIDSEGQAKGDISLDIHVNSRSHDSSEIVKRVMMNQWSHLEHPDSFDASNEYHSQELSAALYLRDMSSSRSSLGYQDQGDIVEFSGPLLSQAYKVDELLEKHERHIRRVVRRSWFQRVSGRRQGK